MNQVKLLQKGGYDVSIVWRDGIQMVEVKRGQAATLDPKVAGELQKAAMRDVDAASQYVAGQIMARLAEAYAETKPLTKDEDECVLIAKLQMALGHEIGSDGTKWMDYLTISTPAKKTPMVKAPVMA